MRPAIALIPSNNKVQKVPVIQRATLCYIFFSSVKFLAMEAVRGTLGEAPSHTAVE